jgi:predicted GNAT superfamily acetyltransferase
MILDSDALRAAAAAGVEVRELHRLDELEAVFRLYDTIWRPDPSNPPITVDMLRALSKAGNYVAGAFDGDGHLVGASVGFFGPPDGRMMHSHLAGVATATRGRSAGFALKLHQRAWALQHGILEIEWTFDPLVGRNVYFNLMKLGGTAAEYLPNFYGGMHDAINGSGDSDRLLVRWRLGDPRVAEACAGRVAPCTAEAALAEGAVVGLARGEHGRPSPGTLGALVLIAVPADIEGLRSADPGAAKEWRVAVRETLGALLDRGATVRGFDKSGWYVVDTKLGDR